MKKNDLLIIDTQIHYLKEDTNSYIQKMISFLKENRNNIQNINLVIDLMHEDNGIDFSFLEYEKNTSFQEGEEYYIELIYELEDKFSEDVVNRFIKFVKEYRLPMSFAKTLILLEEKYNVNINIINKYYGYLRDIIDNDIESLAYYLKLIFELYSLDINYQLIDIDTLNNLYKNNNKIKFILDEFIQNTSFTFEEICDTFNDTLRIEPSELISNYSDIINNSNPIIAMGGGVMECFFEEVSSLIITSDYLKKKLNFNLNTDLIYGEASHLEYEWMEDLTASQIITSEISFLKDKISLLSNKKNKKVKQLIKTSSFH